MKGMKKRKQVTYGWIDRRVVEFGGKIDPRENVYATKGKKAWWPDGWPPVPCKVTIECPVEKPKAKKEKKF